MNLLLQACVIMCAISRTTCQMTTATPRPVGALRNQVTTVGGSATFACQPLSNVAWVFFSLQSTSSCTINSTMPIKPALLPLCPDRSRYSVTAHISGYFNLTISNVQFSDAGTYGCLDQETFDGNGSWTAIFGVIDTNLTVTSNSTCAIRGQSVSYTCRVYYNGSELMPLSMNWTTSGGQTVVGSVNNNSYGWFQSSLIITATPSSSLQSSCSVFFQAPTGNTVSRPTQATNAPNYTSARSYTSCPRSIVVMYNGTEFIDGSNITEGDVLTCNISDTTSGTTALYEWTYSNTSVVISLQSTVYVHSGSITYTCSAWSSCDRINYPCFMNTTVTGYAEKSECQACYCKIECIVPVGIGSIVINVAVTIAIALCLRHLTGKK